MSIARRRTRTESSQHAVARLGVDEAIAAQRLHMDENVLGALAAGEKAEAAGAIEPLDDDNLEAADRAGPGVAGVRRTKARWKAWCLGTGRQWKPVNWRSV